MRNELFKRIAELIKSDERIFFLTGDTGYDLVEPIFKAADGRAINVGVAEQNLIGVAAGLSSMGFIPICYGITNFLVQRPFEQIRNDICLHNKKVVIIGTSTGFDNGALGPTHHMIDDIGALKVLPNLSIYSPYNKNALFNSFSEAMSKDGPSYIRITKFGAKDYLDESLNCFLVNGKGDTLIVSHGKMAGIARQLAIEDGFTSVYVMNRIKPINVIEIDKILSSFKNVIVLEDNFSSGLFNSVCEIVVKSNIKIGRLISMSLEEKYLDRIGSPSYLEAMHGISTDDIKNKIHELKG
jgi:transketolase